MYIIGLTGGTGAGKSTALQALHKMGAHTLDCDEVYHKLLSDSVAMKAEIETVFGDVVTAGRIDRRKLGKIVWSNPASLQELNRITHKYVDNEIDRQLRLQKEKGTKIAAIDAIALIESGQGNKCDIVVGVTAPQEKRLARIMSRDSLTKEDAQTRINAQKPESFFIENCDYILENPYDEAAAFEEKCTVFFRELLKAGELLKEKGYE